MHIADPQRSLVERIVNVFETGNPEGDYGMLVIYNDGPHRMPQITFGRSQTTEYGNLRDLVQRYVDAGGLYSAALAPYAGRIGVTPLTGDGTFKTLLRRAGQEDPVMRHVQDAFFRDAYFQPAAQWADREGFELPLSMLVIYDSFIHSGGMLRFLRARFPERTPRDGGDEKAWTRAYTQARHNWLKSHPNKLLQRTVYRTGDFLREMQAGNWDLSRLPFNAHQREVWPEAV